MTLVLRCPQCVSRLNVPDEAKGATAKCPHCTNVFDVDANAVAEPDSSVNESWQDETLPHPSAAKPEEFPAETPESDELERDPAELANPYAAPATVVATESFEVSKAPMRHGMLVARDAFMIAWEIYLANFGTLLLAHAVTLSIALMFSEFANHLSEQGSGGLVGIIVLVSFGVQWFLMVGLISIALKASRGRRSIEFGELFSGLRKFPSVCIYMTLYFLMVLAGSCLLFFPGIYIALRYWPGVYLIVDRNVGFADAFRMSSHFTAGNKLQLLLVSFYSFIVVLIGVLPLVLGPGALIVQLLAMPMSTMLGTVSFLLMTRQPIPRMPS